jgi:Signal transduction histidine kinase
MSHELRTPLNGIIGASNLLLQEDHLAAQKPHLDILKFSSEHMMMLINDILDYNKIEAGKLELAEAPVNMKELMQKIASQFAGQIKAKGLHFKIDIDDRLDMEFITDETRLNQVLSNLLSNAVKFTHTGTITLAVRKLFSTSSLATLQFIVMDTGIGIPKNKYKEILKALRRPMSTQRANMAALAWGSPSPRKSSINSTAIFCSKVKKAKAALSTSPWSSRST